MEALKAAERAVSNRVYASDPAVDREDFVQEAAIAHLRAERSHDPELGTLEMWTGVAVARSVTDTRRASDRLPRQWRQIQRRMRLAEDVLAQRHGRTPTRREVAAEMAVDPTELAEVAHADQHPEYLDAPRDGPRLVGGGPPAIAETDAVEDPAPAPPDLAEAHLDRERLERALDLVPPREQFVLRATFFLHLREVELAELMNVSKSRISQLKRAGLARLREALPDLAPAQ